MEELNNEERQDSQGANPQKEPLTTTPESVGNINNASANSSLGNMQQNTTPPNTTMPNVASNNVAPNNVVQPIVGSTKKSVKKKSFLIAILSLLFFGIGGAYAYFGVIQPSKPEVILEDAVANFVKHDALRFDGEVELPDNDLLKRPISFSFVADAFDLDNPKFDLEITIPAGLTEINLALRQVDDYAYIKADGLSGLEGASFAFGLDENIAKTLSSISGNWYKLDLKTLGSNVDDQAPINLDHDLLHELYLLYRPIRPVEKLADERIDNVDSYHLRIDIDKDAIQNVLDAYQERASEDNKLTDEDFRSLSTFFDELLNDEDEVEVWVAKKERVFTQLKFSAKRNDTRIIVLTRLKDHDIPQDITEPQNAKTFLDLMNELSPLFYYGIDQEGFNLQNQDDVFNLQQVELTPSEIIPSVLGAFRQR